MQQRCDRQKHPVPLDLSPDLLSPLLHKRSLVSLLRIRSTPSCKAFGTSRVTSGQDPGKA